MLQKLNDIDFKMLNCYLRGFVDAKKASKESVILVQNKNVVAVQVTPYKVQKAEIAEKKRIARLGFLVGGRVVKSNNSAVANSYQEMFNSALGSLETLPLNVKSGVYNNFITAVAGSHYFVARGLVYKDLSVEDNKSEAEAVLAGLSQNFAEFASPIIRARYLQSDSSLNNDF